MSTGKKKCHSEKGKTNKSSVRGAFKRIIWDHAIVWGIEKKVFIYFQTEASSDL